MNKFRVKRIKSSNLQLPHYCHHDSRSLSSTTNETTANLFPVNSPRLTKTRKEKHLQLLPINMASNSTERPRSLVSRVPQTFSPFSPSTRGRHSVGWFSRNRPYTWLNLSLCIKSPRWKSNDLISSQTSIHDFSFADRRRYTRLYLINYSWNVFFN